MDDCPMCHALRVRIAQLENRLSVKQDDFDVASIMSRLGLTKTQARIVLRLYMAGGLHVSNATLVEELPFGGQADSLKVHIVRIRDAVGSDFVNTTYGEGYALTPNGLSRTLAALEPVEIQRVTTLDGGAPAG